MSDRDEFKRVEGTYSTVGLGNADAERIIDFLNEYEKMMDIADQVRRRKKKGQKDKKPKGFKDIFEGAREGRAAEKK